jgi:hypothetical protein
MEYKGRLYRDYTNLAEILITRAGRDDACLTCRPSLDCIARTVAAGEGSPVVQVGAVAAGEVAEAYARQIEGCEGLEVCKGAAVQG